MLSLALLRPLIFLLGATWATASLSAGTDRLQFGLLRFGMSAEEARAALPGVQWNVVDENPKTHRPYTIKAYRLLAVGDVTFDAEVGWSQSSSAPEWILESHDMGSSAVECESRVIRVTAELEHRVGVFHHLGDVWNGEVLIKVGESSDAKIVAGPPGLATVDPTKIARRDPALFYFRARHDSAYGTDPTVTSLADYDRQSGRSCVITVRMDGSPPVRQVSFSESRLLARPTAAYRSRSLSDIGAPEKTLKFVVRCTISAADGQIESCPWRDDADPYRKLASQWAERYRLQLADPQSDDLGIFLIDVPVTMGIDDIRTVDLSTGRIVALKEYTLKPARTRFNFDDFYTAEMRALKQPEVVVALRCKVQEDGSVICGTMPDTTPPPKPFVEAAIKVGETFEVQTKLRDGTSAVGTLLERRIRFTSK
jgi:hypothetical protein